MAGDTNPLPAAYCFYKVFEPEVAKTVQFDRHYLMYSAKGTMRIEIADRWWFLPPAKAAWIPAGTPIKVVMSHAVTCCSILYQCDFARPAINACRVFSVSSLAREMILHCRRWGIDTGRLDDYATQFFLALAQTCNELAAAPSENWIPKGKSEVLHKAMEFTHLNFAAPLNLDDVAQTLNVTPRTLSRRFADETGMSWGQILRRMRMIRAVELLVATDHQIVQVAFDVGYASISAFNRAFRDFCCQSPSEFRATLR